ncbi:U4 U6 snRNP-specific spliceosomal protein [Lentinula edodes]|uniref:U4 U6 snRNP-specific spliceosomal protein n=1 Tax=Lentinula edodes TaxID=5353 RepID=A0A1Q3DZI6_LENED|nr:U4 U6 snRNP-specific spliceosomal protein [Lentinula edodes]
MAELTYDTLMDDGNYLGSERARMENQVILNELERKKKARNIAVPTDDNRVRARLREIGEPITLFGERPADRRDRLIYVLSQIKHARGDDGMQVDESSDESEDEEEESEFYTPGSLELLEARRKIAEYSLPRAQKRVAQQLIDSKMELGRIVDIRKKVFGEVKKFAILGSQIGDERPISQVRFSPNNEILVTGSCTLTSSDRVGGVAWHPQATLNQSPDSVNLRITSVRDYVASASYDTSWRLWDVATSQELLLQEGHSREVYSIEFQNDGALVASGGLDAIGRVWDLRTGRTAMVLDGHVQGIYSVAFSPNGYQIATGAGDDTIRIWDMRSLKSLYTIPGHTSNISDVRFFQANDLFFKKPQTPEPTSPDVNGDTGANESAVSSRSDTPKLDKPEAGSPTFTPEEEWSYRSGLFFASGGYDGYVKLWSADDWQLLRTLTTDSGKVMSVDISSNGHMIAAGTYNRNYQLYSDLE